MLIFHLLQQAIRAIVAADNICPPLNHEQTMQPTPLQIIRHTGYKQILIDVLCIYSFRHTSRKMPAALRIHAIVSYTFFCTLLPTGLLGALIATAASFDYTKAKTSTEKAICNELPSPELDGKIALAFNTAKELWPSDTWQRPIRREQLE